MTEGRAYALLPGGRREELAAGDIVVLPHGDAHSFGNGAPAEPLDTLKTLAETLSQGLRLTRFGGGGEMTKFVCGYMACDPRLSKVFLAGLPKLLKVSIAKDSSDQWLANLIRFSVTETNESNAGSGLVLARLSEVLFIETLRRYINSCLPGKQAGLRAHATRSSARLSLFCTRSPRRAGPSRILQDASVCHAPALLSGSGFFWENPRSPTLHNGG